MKYLEPTRRAEPTAVEGRGRSNRGNTFFSKSSPALASRSATRGPRIAQQIVFSA